MKYVAVHADDFGLSIGTNSAIVHLLEKGAIQSTTIMANGAAFEDAVARVSSSGRGWPVGLHVNLTEGVPCGPLMDLAGILDGQGEFAGRRALWKACGRGSVSIETLAGEIDAQWSRCTVSGIKLTHIDTHQHVHAIPEVHAATWVIARKHGVGVRILRLSTCQGSLLRRFKSRTLNRMAKRGERSAMVKVPEGIELLSIFQTSGLPAVESYRSLLDRSASRFIELMVHPALVDEVHRISTEISGVSAMDYEVLSSPEWAQFLESGSYRCMPTHELLIAAGMV